MSGRNKQEERAFILECIQVYRDLPALWKIGDKDYSNKHKKEESYQKLLTKYQERFDEATVDDVKKRFNILRTNFRKELKKENDFLISQDGTKECYISTLWYYDAMTFLKDQGIITASRWAIEYNADQADDSSRDESISQLPEIPISSPPYRMGPSEKRKQVSNNGTMETCEASPCKRLRDDINLGLTKYWASEISEMAPDQQLLAKKAINDILFEGRMGTLHRGSVLINQPTSTVPFQEDIKHVTPHSYTNTVEDIP